MHFLGIEIGGTKLQLAVGRGDGVLLACERARVQPERGAEAILRELAQLAGDLSAKWGAPSAVGVGFGGPLDARAGRVARSNHVSGWDNFALVDWLRAELGTDMVVLHNDSDAAALAEALFGAGVGCSPLLYVNNGSGVGGGLVIDETLYQGAGGAIEIGHVVVEEPDAPEGSCLTLEQVASGWAIARAGRAAIAEPGAGETSLIAELCEGDPARVTGELVGAAALRGDGVALAILRRAQVAMGRALAAAVNLLVPRRMILGGGVSQLPDHLWLDPIRRELEPRVFDVFRQRMDLARAALGQEVVLHGALALAERAYRTGSSG